MLAMALLPPLGVSCLAGGASLAMWEPLVQRENLGRWLGLARRDSRSGGPPRWAGGRGAELLGPHPLAAVRVGTRAPDQPPDEQASDDDAPGEPPAGVAVPP